MRSTVAFSLCGVLAACASSSPPSSRDLAEVWLAEAPRTIQVRAEPMPDAQVRSHDFRGGARVGGAILGAGAGALSTVAVGCGGGPLGCAVGLFLAPVGAAIGGVAGAVSVKSRESVHPATSDGDAQRVLAAGRSDDVPAMLVDAFLAEQRNFPRHALQREDGEASWVWRVTTVELVGSANKEPPQFLKLEAEAQVISPVAVVTMGPYRYESGYRRADEWIADDGRAMREELVKATRSMASSAASALNAGPGSGASARVAASRARKDREPEAQEPGARVYYP